MKFCDIPFKFLYFDYFDGRVMLCPWMRNPEATPGNIFESSLEEIWHNERSRNIRNTILDGSFCLCRPDACPHIQNSDLMDYDSKEVDRIAANAIHPTHFNLAYDYVCNQFCETCRPEKFKVKPQYPKIMEIFHKRIAPVLNSAKYISASGHGDPFASPYTLKLLSEARNPEQVLLETNGVFFDPPHWEKVKHFAEASLSVIITINSFSEWNYRHISRGGNYARLMQNLDFVAGLRREGKIKSLALTMVIQDRNFREMPEFVTRCLNQYGCDQVLLRPVYQWGTMPEDVFWFKDVLNPLHPYHGEYLEIVEDSALKDPRVYNFAGKSLHPARSFPCAG